MYFLKIVYLAFKNVLWHFNLTHKNVYYLHGKTINRVEHNNVAIKSLLLSLHEGIIKSIADTCLLFPKKLWNFLKDDVIEGLVFVS